MNLADSFYIGYITKTKGLKGEVQVFFEYPHPEDLDLDTLFLEFNGKLVPYFTQEIALQNNQTANIYLEDVDVIEKAQTLVRKKIYLPNTKKPERNPNEFLISDLKGFKVVDAHEGELGEIKEVHEYPQQFVASVLYQEREILFPLSDDLIEEVDQDKNTLYVHLPEGLVDLYLNN
ncbi:MAG: ribosome maturation factor RimM [Sphingobacteriaceae bacterium]